MRIKSGVWYWLAVASGAVGLLYGMGLEGSFQTGIGFCACTLCLPKKTSSNINDFDCRCSRHSIRPFGRNACCLELTAALTSRTISPMRATHRIEFFPLPAVQALHCPSGRYDLN